MKTFNLISASLLALILGATVGVFYLLVPESVQQSAIFFFNMVLCLILETMLFFSIFVIAKKEKFTTQNIALSYRVIKYAVGMLMIMGIYTAISFLSPVQIISVKWYFAALIIFTMIYAVILTVTFTGGKAQVAAAEETTHIARQAKAKTLEYDFIQKEFLSAIRGRQLDAAKLVAAKNSVNSAVNSIKSVPSTFFVEKPEYVSQIETRFDELNSLIQEFGHTEDDEAGLTLIHKINTVAKGVANYISVAKKA